MSPDPIVEALDVLENGLSGLCSCLKGSTFDALAFERPEKRFSDCIIITSACAAHTHRDTHTWQHGSRLHHWYIVTLDQNETAIQLVDIGHGEP